MRVDKSMNVWLRYVYTPMDIVIPLGITKEQPNKVLLDLVSIGN